MVTVTYVKTKDKEKSKQLHFAEERLGTRNLTREQLEDDSLLLAMADSCRPTLEHTGTASYIHEQLIERSDYCLRWTERHMTIIYVLNI